MKAIHKNTEPKALVEHRAQAHCDYANVPADTKQALRNALVAEQGGICCYCMGRIRPDADSMKIEHWACQHAHPELQLAYTNLLGACLGGEGQPQDKQHCDTRKGSSGLKWNPADLAHTIESRIRYDIDGTIRSDDEDFDRQLDDVLNLNLTVIRNARGGIMATIATWWKQEKSRRKGPVPRQVIEKKLNAWADASTHQPHSGVAILELRRRLAKAA